MPDFKKPNLSAKTGTTGEAFLSIHSDRQVLSISSRARETLGTSPGKHLLLALDRTHRPWVGVLDEETGQGEPEIHGDSKGATVNSTLMARHLMSLIDGAPGGCVRFHLSGETAEDPDTGATLHRLEVPEA
jgi:hypothetical protein